MSSERISCCPFFNLHHTTKPLLGENDDRLSHVFTVGPSFPPNRIDLLVPLTERKEGQTASASILVALLICCSARNTAHVSGLYLASSHSSVRLNSCRIVVISACSWPSQLSCFFRKFHPPLLIVHPCPGSRHVVRPSVVMILILSTRSFHTCDECWILRLTKPLAGIF